jgi:hypothetical protein
MHIGCGLILLSGLYPFWHAWQANRQTTLRPALLWALAAWAVWLAVVSSAGDSQLLRYLALSLTGCAGVAVLGARRPGIGAWHFVVVGFLAVLLLPVAQGLGQPRLQPAHLIFLGAGLAVTLLNYLPTRFALAVLVFGAACAIEILQLAGVTLPEWLQAPGQLLAAISPWVALILAHRNDKHLSEVDRVWLSFRDRFGGVWGLRQQDQLNRAAANAGWPVILTWQGMRYNGVGTPPSTVELLALLRSVLKRFGLDKVDAKTVSPRAG